MLKFNCIVNVPFRSKCFTQCSLYTFTYTSTCVMTSKRLLIFCSEYDNSPITRGGVTLRRRDAKSTTSTAAVSSMTTRSQQLSVRLRRGSHSFSSNRRRSSTTPTSSIALMEEVERMIVEESEEARRMEMVCTAATASPSMESLARRISSTHMHVETTTHYEVVGVFTFF